METWLGVVVGLALVLVCVNKIVACVVLSKGRIIKHPVVRPKGIYFPSKGIFWYIWAQGGVVHAEARWTS